MFTINISMIRLLFLVLLASCLPQNKRERVSLSKTENALTFINNYVENCNKKKQSIDVVEWVKSSDLVTTDFKDELKKVMDEASEKEPAVGLGADPLFNAQYYPDKGFELDSFEEKSNYLVVKGKNLPEFKVIMKIVNENKKWLVDGCGLIRVP